MLNFLRSLNPWPKCVVCGEPAPVGSDLCLSHRDRNGLSYTDGNSASDPEYEPGAISLPEINCPFCATTNSSVAPFCTNCGSALPMPGRADREQSGGNADPVSRQELQTEINELRAILRDASGRLLYIQRRLNRLDPQTETAVPPATALTPAEALSESMGTGAEAPAPGVAPTPPEPAPPVASAPQTVLVSEIEPETPADGGVWPVFSASFDWERLLGRNWFAIIGAVALVLGIGFFLKLAFDNNWIGDTGRIVLGVVLGLSLLGVGEYAQRRVPIWAQPVTAAGAVILYLSIYAAFGLYQLIRPDVALLFLALVVALVALLALRHESIVVALLGIIGAFLAPALLGADLPDVRLALAYILVVDAGILAISTFRNWRWFNLVGWAGTYGVFFFWTSRFSDYDPVMAQIGLSGMFLILAGATSLFHLLWRRVPGIPDLALMTLNAVAFFALTYHVLWDDYRDWFGLIALGLSLFYALIAFAAIRRPFTPTEIAIFALPMAIVFLTIAVPLQLTGVWITVGWAAEGAALVGTAFLLGRWQMRAFGLGVLAVGLGHLVVIDLLRHGGRINLGEFVPFLNERFPIMAATVVALYAAAFLYHRYRERREPWEEFVLWPLLGVANALTVVALSLELVSYFDSRALVADGPGRPVLQRATDAKLLSLTALWSIYGFILAAIGLRRRWPLMRWAGLALLGLTVLKLVTIDTIGVQLAQLGFPPVLNFQFLTCALVVALLAVLAWRFRREAAHLFGYERQAFVVLVVSANLVALWTLNQEIIHYFDGRAVRYDGYDLLPPQFHYAQVAMNAKYLSMTYLWSVYGAIVLAVGLWRRLPLVRWAGLGILALAALKLLAFDTFMVELVPSRFIFIPFLNLHFLAFALVIALMLVFTWWYRRVRPESARFETYAVPALLVAANCIALWGLTLEAVHFFDARTSRLGADTFGAQQLSLTVLWAVYAVGVIGVGIARQSSRIRLAGIALLAVPLVKLFGFDVFLLEREYRVAAFVTLGVLMLGTGLVYQRYSQAVRGFLFGQRA